jgi:formamidopyrimidine-DNA glycosylase
MPELPEVETMRREVAQIVGCTIRDFQQPPSHLQPIEVNPSPKTFRRHVIGRRVTAVGRVGKRLILELDTTDRIVIEPRMSGLVLLDRSRQPKKQRRGTTADKHRRSRSNITPGSPRFPPNKLPERTHLRIILKLSGTVKQLLFWDQRGFGIVRLVSPAAFDAIYGPEKIGPDALQISAATLRERLGSSNRAIKVALLDQHLLAGIGNIYASEILYRVGIHPTAPCNTIRPRQWTKLHAQMLKVLHEAICHQGSTLRDRLFRNTDGEPGKYEFRVYQRHGELCQKCKKTKISRIVLAQRSTFFCPTCQSPDTSHLPLPRQSACKIT